MKYSQFIPADFAERDRRWKNVQREIIAQGLDAIIVVSDGHFSRRANFRYITNCLDHAHEGWHFAIIPAEGKITALNCNDGWLEDENRRSVPYRGTWLPETELYAKYLIEILLEKGLEKAKIGIDNDYIPWTIYRNLLWAMPNAMFVDSNIVMKLRNIKSPYEIEHIHKSAAMLDNGYEALLKKAHLGMTWNQVTSLVTEEIFASGGEVLGGFELSRSNEIIGRGDTYVYYPEMGGSMGYWVQMGRVAAFGESDKSLEEDWELNIKAQTAAAELLRPGYTGSDVAQAVADVLKGSRYEAAARSSGHGMGLSGPERPWISADDQTQIVPNMLVVIHPAVNPKHPKFQGNAETYLTTCGAPVKLSKHGAELRVIE